MPQAKMAFINLIKTNSRITKKPFHFDNEKVFYTVNLEAYLKGLKAN
ncbi:hypothetical protein SAMN05444484_10860 [Flavobacterium chilense]|uniref:Uncharacterized protein n=1 Tax=Flavobacterium chilense TaxID=946677 RepID=A0A1M7KNR4_9FLAO|nr:hypothetical protein SAMN05444484_10860 [Flavobacterium chilense]